MGRADAVGPLLTTRWSQDAPYNNYCPSLSNDTHAVTGCVATATAQVMNYHKWPPVGNGSHSYICYLNYNYANPVELNADFSQSVYRWDLMLDDYDENSSAESCDAVARLMSDVGISMEMQYGSSSAASVYYASSALKRYFGYSSKCYWLQRENYNAAQWDQLLVDEIGAGRPVMYSGNEVNAGHAFVIDGFDTEGYFHVNWGWGGYYDGFFLVSVLAPANMNFKYEQEGLFGLVPEPQSDAIEDYLHLYCQFWEFPSSAPLGTNISINFYIIVEGNTLDYVGHEVEGDFEYDYALIPIKLSLQDSSGVERKSEQFSFKHDVDKVTWGQYIPFDLPQSLEDGEYYLKAFYSLDDGANYDHPLVEQNGKEAYIKVIVQGDTAYLKDCFLYNMYGMESFSVPGGVKVNEEFSVGVNLSYEEAWSDLSGYKDGPTGNVYLSLLKDGVEVATGPMCEVMVPVNTVQTYMMQLTAPSESGLYDVVLNDESGNHIMKMNGWQGRLDEVTAPVFILPDCPGLVEDFETMTVNSSTSDKDVQGRFTTWSFNKCGVRAPGEDRCNGNNSVMMKKSGTIYTTQPLHNNFFLAQVTFFNPTSTLSKCTLEYSVDGGDTWERASTLDGATVAEVQPKSQFNATWHLGLNASQPAQFRIAMTGGGSGATYVDDFALYYLAATQGDVNGDGEVNISDLNAVIHMILTGNQNTIGDVNGDGGVNITDINALINLILSGH